MSVRRPVPTVTVDILSALSALYQIRNKISTKMETKKLDSIRMGCSYVSPEIKEISIKSRQILMGSSEQNMNPEEGGTW